jgi:uncharacterized protein YcbX
MGTILGTVQRLTRYPVKSAGGEDLHTVDVGPSGLDGDRRWALVTATGEPVTARTAPGLREVGAAVADGGVTITDASGHAHHGQEALDVLAAVVGQPVRWDEASTSHVDVAAVHVVSDGAAGAADAPGGCDPEPRANVVLDLAEPGSERGWVGRRLRVGAVELRVTRTPQRCLGVYAEVLVPGQVSTGDEVVLLGD